MTATKIQIMKTYLQPSFLICVALLGLSAAGMSIGIKKFGLYMEKEPLPLKKSLDLLDENGLGSFKVISKSKIDNKDVIDSLGTEEYIQWVIEDPAAAKDSPVRRCMLFITYYPIADKVPHVPEECYSGGGYQKQSSESVIFEMGPDGANGKIAGRRLVFVNSQSTRLLRVNKFPVLYLFKVNGIYANSREQARVALNRNIFGKHSYFCKVELVFNQSSSAPAKEESVRASAKLLNVILPILEKEHWPQWEDN